MPTLRLTQHAGTQPDRYRVEVALEGDDLPRQTAVARFAFSLTPQDQEDMRWYLEDYMQTPFGPEQQIAARVERRVAEIGVELFKAVFHAGALSLVMEKFTAASIFRGENASQALLTVRGSGNFTAEIISRVMDRARGHTDDLETLFARYNELEENSEMSVTNPPQTDL